MRTAFHCLLLMLLSALLPRGMLAGIYVRIQLGNHSNAPGPSLPYLSTLGCTPLRFREATVAPEVTTRPAAGAPPEPHLTQAESAVSQANAAAVQPAPPKPAHDEAPVTPTTENDAPPASNAPISILPDTVRPQLQAEDFLPFFVIPESAKKPAVPVPSEPGQLPPSTATYTEK